LFSTWSRLNFKVLNLEFVPFGQWRRCAKLCRESVVSEEIVLHLAAVGRWLLPAWQHQSNCFNVLVIEPATIFAHLLSCSCARRPSPGPRAMHSAIIGGARPRLLQLPARLSPVSSAQYFVLTDRTAERWRVSKQCRASPLHSNGAADPI